MQSRLPATHLLRHLMLFTFIGIFMMTMIRAGYVLWQFPKVMESNAIIDVFLMGLRYDLALLGILLLPVLILGCLFGMLNATRKFARFLVIVLLMLGMLFLLLTELITPSFMVEQSLRPDLPILAAIEDPVSLLKDVWSTYMIQVIVGLVVVLLVMIAYWARLEVSRLFRFGLAPLSTILLLVIGVVLCALAIYSGIDPSQPPLTPMTGLISSETVVNEIALNTGYKLLFSVVSPYL